MGSLVVVSLVFEPLVIGRTLLPGLLPIAAGLALGIGVNRRRIVRVAAAASISMFMLMACENGVRQAFVPQEGLRGLAAAVRSRYRPGDQLVLFRSMDYGLAPYWEGVHDTHPLLIDQTKPIQPQLAEERRRLAALPRPERVLVVWRNDYYLSEHAAEVSACLGDLSAFGLTPREVWRDGDLVLLEGDAQAR
jgi:hypothetical protein